MCSCKITDPYIKSLSLTWQLCALVTKYYNRWILRIASVVGGTLCSLSITLRPCRGGGGGSHVARLNFKTSHGGVYKCLSLIVGFAVTVAILRREVVSCHDFILHAVATFWAMSLIGIYPGRASTFHLPTNLPPPLQSMLHTTSG